MLRVGSFRRWASALVLTTGLAIAGSASVSAQDLNYTGGHSFNWTGGYVGGTIGGGVGDNNGVIGGATLGYNTQANGAIWGIETDFSGSGISNGGAKLKWLGTLRGRVGFNAGNGLMPFITAGWAYGRLEGSAGGFSASKNKSGWTAGGGLEYAIDPNWTVKGEYLYVDLGTLDIAATGGTVSFDNIHVLRGGLNLKF